MNSQFHGSNFFRVLFSVALLGLSLVPLSAQELERVNNVNISSRMSKNILIQLDDDTVQTFPYDQQYGPESYWTRWSLIRNADETHSFQLDGKYLGVDANGNVRLTTAKTSYEKFYLEKEDKSYFIKSWRGSYLSCTGSGWADVAESWNKSLAAEWYFLTTYHPSQSPAIHVVISNLKHKNIVQITSHNANPKVSTFHYDRVYGLGGYPTRFSFGFDNGFYIKLWRLYLSHDNSKVVASETLGNTGRFILEEEANGSYYIKTNTGKYWKGQIDDLYESNIVLTDTKSTEALWTFFEVISPTINPDRPTADPGEDLTNYQGSRFYFDGSDSSDPNGDGPLTFDWTLLQKPFGSNASFDNTSALQPRITGDVPGLYIAKLVVTNASGISSAPVTAFLRVKRKIKYGTQNNVDDDVDVVYFTSTRPLPEYPVLFADMQTMSGSDPAGLRLNNVDVDGFDVWVEEEKSKNKETDHGSETIGYMAMTEGAIYNAEGDLIGEVGLVEKRQNNAGTWHTISNFIGEYENPVVLMKLNSANDSDPAHVRLRSVTYESFQYKIEEWDYQDGTHGEEIMSYMILEAGVHTLNNGLTLQAQTQSVDQDLETVRFAESFGATPVVFSQSQTTEGSSAIVTRQKSVSTSSVRVRVQEQEKGNGNHNDETVAVVSLGEL
ncbi:hypothetical protein SCOR_30795 [Sulfidibacter corallicola]|uniref:PKD domain-containing protein n=1 Tax=Sulfidibacter corallicola TaxID=2818388 RepID=A0A8A4TMD9_SULCO|nr:hypothetical protein [Sulfidibacter corallicola]QTD50058.1 hypothetical protein J3U87_31120 [Sulfidibacter corallicola]